jgi:hypothetical protein
MSDEGAEKFPERAGAAMTCPVCGQALKRAPEDERVDCWARLVEWRPPTWMYFPKRPRVWRGTLPTAHYACPQGCVHVALETWEGP